MWQGLRRNHFVRGRRVLEGVAGEMDVRSVHNRFPLEHGRFLLEAKFRLAAGIHCGENPCV